MGLLRVNQVARLLGVNGNTVRNWENRGLLTALRIGPRRDRRFDESEVKRFMTENNKTGVKGEPESIRGTSCK